MKLRKEKKYRMKRMKKGLFLCVLTALAVLCLAFAACGAKTFKLELISDGVTVEPVEVEQGGEFTLPTPERDGYAFEGWYADPGYSGTPVVSGTAEENKTFYAKWAKLYSVSLDAAGGTLSQSSLSLKGGESLSSALQELDPVKPECEFGGWFLGDRAIGENERMPEEDIVLTARYKVGYTVEIYAQSLKDHESYEKIDTVKAYAFADGSEFTPDVQLQGMTQIEHADAVTKKQLSDSDPASNVFKFYFDRSEVVVFFDPNDGSGSESLQVEGLYGEEISLPIDFYRAGYVLSGWCASPAGDGEVYATNFVEANSYFGEETEMGKYTLTQSTALYAVWEKGYSDMFGGYDFVYVIGENVYLQRAGFFFPGEARGGLYTFSIGGKIALTCKLFADGTFCYADDSRASYSAILYSIAEGLDDSVTLYLGEYNELRYSVLDSKTGESSTSKGTYTVDEYGYRHTNFTEGDMVGQDFVFFTATVSTQNVFLIRNDEEYEMGVIYLMAFAEGGLQVYPEVYQLRLDGFGNADLYTGSGVETFFYVFEEYNGQRLLELVTEDNELFGIFSISELEENDYGYEYGYFFFDIYTCGEFIESSEEEDGGSDLGTLELDGTCRGTFTKGGKEETGYYLAEDSAFGDTIVTFYTDGGEKYVFAVWESSSEDESSAYYLQLTSAYTEYYFSVEGGAMDSPLLVVGETAENGFSLYATGETGYELAVSGTISAVEDGKFLATVTAYGDTAASLEWDIDFSKLQSFVYSAGTIETEDGYLLNVSYWWSVDAGEETGLTGNYTLTESGKEGTLTVVGGYAVYRSGEEEFSGSFADLDLCYVIISEEGEYLYLSVNEEENTFVLLDGGILGYFFEWLEDGTPTDSQYLLMDGLGGAVYTVIPPAEEGTEAEPQKTPGKIAKKGTATGFGYNIYTFTAEDGGLTFDFICFMNSGYYFFTRAGEYEGEYTSLAGETLTLDGFGLMASYETNGILYSGIYHVAGENLVCVTIPVDGEEAILYFDLDHSGAFTLRGPEYAAYLIFDNQNFRDETVMLNGYGALTVYSLDSGEEVGGGDYHFNDDGTVTLSYQIGGAAYTLVGVLGSYDLSDASYYCFYVLYEEVATVYVNEKDWSALILDGYGTAIRINEKGLGEMGGYTLVTDDLLYYENAESTYAALYIYDSEAFAAQAIDLEETDYYTEELGSLIFTRYGFVVKNNERVSFYNRKKDGVVLYSFIGYDEPDANKYGFEERNIGTFGDTLEFEEETYYLNDSYAVSFARKEGETRYPYPVSSATKVPLEVLTFVPTGEEIFASRGVVLITVDGSPEQTDCAVLCITDEEGSSWYLMIGSSDAYYQYEIELHYQGSEDSYYSVLSMSYTEEYVSYDFLYNLESAYYYDYMFGTNYLDMLDEADWGHLYLTEEYDERGESTGLYLDAEFGINYAMYDADGNLIDYIEYAACDVITGGEESDEENPIFEASFEGEDGNTYNIYFRFAYFTSQIVQGLDMPAFYVIGVARTQDLSLNEDLTLRTERTIFSEAGYEAGEMLNVLLFDHGEEIEYAAAYPAGDLKVVIVLHELDESGVVLKSEHYIVTLTEETKEDAPEGYIPFYASATFEKKDATTVYNADRTAMIEIYDDGTIAFLYTAEGGLIAIEKTSEISQDETTARYEVTDYEGNSYDVTITTDENGEQTVSIQTKTEL